MAGYNPPPAWAGTPPVDRAAHLYECFYAWRVAQICTEEGIAEADRIAGAKLAEERKNSRLLDRELYGDPAYGSRRA